MATATTFAHFIRNASMFPSALSGACNVRFQTVAARHAGRVCIDGRIKPGPPDVHKVTRAMGKKPDDARAPCHRRNDGARQYAGKDGGADEKQTECSIWGLENIVARGRGIAAHRARNWPVARNEPEACRRAQRGLLARTAYRSQRRTCAGTGATAAHRRLAQGSRFSFATARRPRFRGQEIDQQALGESGVIRTHTALSPLRARARIRCSSVVMCMSGARETGLPSSR